MENQQVWFNSNSHDGLFSPKGTKQQHGGFSGVTQGGTVQAALVELKTVMDKAALVEMHS